MHNMSAHLFEWHRSLDDQKRHGQTRPDADSRNDEETFLQAQTEGVAVEPVEEAVTYRGEGVACPADRADDAEARVDLAGCGASAESQRDRGFGEHGTKTRTGTRTGMGKGTGTEMAGETPTPTPTPTRTHR